jgi:O-antigen/teichoic acid export membrane protein/SAM-dependent methyltransferase
VTAAVPESGAEPETGAKPESDKPPRDGRSASSSFQVLAAEALVVPTGILVAALVTRTLGASGYGLFTLALAIVLAAENVLGSFFGRATVKLVSEASDPRPAAAAASRLYFALGLVAMLLLWAAAEPLARLFEAPRFAVLLRIAALDLPAAALARSLRDTLIGLGRFDRRARAAAVRWSSRLVLIAVALLAGLGVEGALAACVGATLLEALASRTGLGLLTASTAGFPLSRLLAYSLPLFVYGLGVSLFARLDLFALKSLGFDAAAVGLYAAAANASGSFQFGAAVLSPLLLSTLSRQLADGRLREARALVRDALRFALLAIPFAAIAAGAAPELLRLVYGAGFESAAPVMRLLMVAAAAHVVTGVAVGAIVAAGHTWRMAALGALPPLAALAGYLLAIPRFGPLGAAAVSTAVAVATAAATLALVAAAWEVLPPAATALRAVLVAVPLVAIALLWQPSALGTLLEVAVLGAAAALLLAAAGELDGIELQRVAAGVRRLLGRPASAPAWDRVPAALDRRGHYLDRFLGRLKRREVLALVARWQAGGAGWVLKTDLFEEAMGPDALLAALGGGARRPLGMDVSPAIVARARRRDAAGAGRYVVADARRLPFAAGALHMVVSPSSLDHFADPHDLQRSLVELRRALAPGGRLVITLDNRGNVTDPLLHLVAAAGLVGYFIGRSYTARELADELRQAGFRVLDQAGLLHNPRLAASGAVAVARRLDRPALSRWVRRRLLAARRLESTRWRYLTASFVAALAVPDEPHEAEE